jgi:uncharacterized protein (DUF302 family)
MKSEAMNDSGRIVVSYREEGRVHERFQHLRVTDLVFDEMLKRLRSAIEREDIMVLHEVDAQAILNRSNYAIGPARQILFFHPRLMARLLQGDTSALLEAPLKFSVIQGEDKVFVRWQDPAPVSTDMEARNSQGSASNCRACARKSPMQRSGRCADATLHRELLDGCANELAPYASRRRLPRTQLD